MELPLQMTWIKPICMTCLMLLILLLLCHWNDAELYTFKFQADIFQLPFLISETISSANFSKTRSLLSLNISVGHGCIFSGAFALSSPLNHDPKHEDETESMLKIVHVVPTYFLWYFPNINSHLTKKKNKKKTQWAHVVIQKMSFILMLMS